MLEHFSPATFLPIVVVVVDTVLVVVVDTVLVVVVDTVLVVDVTVHRKPLADFLHSYLTFFAVRNAPAFTHLVPTICGAALETGETLENVRDKQIPRKTPMCFLTI